MFWKLAVSALVIPAYLGFGAVTAEAAVLQKQEVSAIVSQEPQYSPTIMTIVTMGTEDVTITTAKILIVKIPTVKIPTVKIPIMVATTVLDTIRTRTKVDIMVGTIMDIMVGTIMDIMVDTTTITVVDTTINLGIRE
jgi:hypothetical protein